jgi:hypothetical protein
MSKQARLPDQFKLTAAQQRFYDGGPRRILRGPSRDTKAVLAALREAKKRA